MAQIPGKQIAPWIDADEAGAAKVYNSSGAAFAAGQIVSVTGATGDLLLTGSLADADSTATNVAVLMVASQAIPVGRIGVCTPTKVLTGVDTSGSTAGDPIYLSGTAGGWSLTAGTFARQVGQVLVVSATVGKVLLFPSAYSPGSVGGPASDAILVTDSGSGVAAGALVYASSYSGGQMVVGDASNTTDADLPLYVAAAAIAAGADGYVVRSKILTGVDTSASSAAGAPVYLSTAGGWTVTAPVWPARVQVVGEVLVDHASAGVVLLAPGQVSEARNWSRLPASWAGTSETAVDMADAAHTLVFGTAGAAQTKITSNIIHVDANSTGASETLTLPVASFTGPLIFKNTGGEVVSLSDPTGPTPVVAIYPGESAVVWSNNTLWFGFNVPSNVQEKLGYLSVVLTPGTGGAAAGSVAVAITRPDGSAMKTSGVKLTLIAVDNASEPESVASVLTTVSFASATAGSILASGAGWALVDTGALGTFACTVEDSADEAVSLRARGAHSENAVVLAPADDTATWTA